MSGVLANAHTDTRFSFQCAVTRSVDTDHVVSVGVTLDVNRTGGP